VPGRLSLDLLATVETLDQFGPTILAEIQRLIPSHISSWNEVDPLAERALVVGRPRQVSAAEIEV
jgi:hypothetical protein